jgi:hypothetical protein
MEMAANPAMVIKPRPPKLTGGTAR